MYILYFNIFIISIIIMLIIRYSTWPKTLRQLAYPSWSLVTIARNLYTLIANPDITTRSGYFFIICCNHHPYSYIL
jgi:hypothetical protein